MRVSVVPCWGCAVVLLVSTSPRCCALCAKKFALRGLMVGVSAKKFALHAQNTPNSAFLRLLGEFFRGSAAGGAVLGEFFRGRAAGGAVLGEFFAEVPLEGPCWASFFAEEPLEGVCWASLRTGSRGIPRGELCCAAALVVSPSTGSVNPSIRSYPHLVVAGRGRPPPPPTTLPATQSVDKGKVPSGQGRDKP